MQTGPKKTRVYQCADVNLVEAANFVATMEYECRNFTSSTQTRGGANTAAASSDKAESTQAASTVQFTGSSVDDSKISKAAAGGIGAAAAVVFIAAVLAVLGFTGFVSFGRKNKQVAEPAPTRYYNSDADVSPRPSRHCNCKATHTLVTTDSSQHAIRCRGQAPYVNGDARTLS